MAALQYVDVPGYTAILFRRTYSDLSLPGALMDRAREWLEDTDARWLDKTKTWQFPSGATLTFAYLDNERDKYRYKGTELQFCGFDELTQFSESQYRYLFSRLRRLKGVDIPIRMRAASNPGDMGHEWVKQRFIVEGRAKGRVFIPATLADNPYIDAAEYEGTLSELDAVTRAQLMDGDWEVRPEGKLFQREWFEIVPQAPLLVRKVRFWDLAATEPKHGEDADWTVGVLLGLTRDGVLYVLDVVRVQKSPLGVEEIVRQTALADGVGVPVVMEQEPGATGKMSIDHYAREVLAGFEFHGAPSTGDKVVRARPVSSHAEKGLIKLVAGPWVTDFLNELAAFPTAGVHDDQVDALSGAFARLTQPKPFWQDEEYLNSLSDEHERLGHAETTTDG